MKSLFYWKNSSTELVRVLYGALCDSPSLSTIRRFNEWRSYFEFVHGTLERKRIIDRKKLSLAYGLSGRSIDIEKLLFAIETYFAFAMKLHAYIYLSKSINGSLMQIENWKSDRIRLVLMNICSGSGLREFGIENYGDGKLFDWFLLELEEQKFEAVCRIVKEFWFNHIPISDLTDDDLISHLYHALFPKQVRHSVGATYTPNWIAHYVIESLRGRHKLARFCESRVLDPTCGSGTFLMAALSEYLKLHRVVGVSADETATMAGSNLAGFEINPVAVLASKTNWIFFLSKLFTPARRTSKRSFKLPIYLCDSILPPQMEDHERVSLRLGNHVHSLPRGLFSSQRKWSSYVEGLIQRVRLNKQEQLPFHGHPREFDEATHSEPFGELGLSRFLQKQNDEAMLDFYSGVLKDSAAPLFTKKYEFIVGNPPWVNWEYLPPSYRSLIAPLWPKLGLFSLKGKDLSNSKEDVSVLAAYVSASNYLVDGGKLAFVMPQSIFKSSLNAAGFRRFQVGKNGSFLKVLGVDDLTDIKVFTGVSNRPSVIFLQKGHRTIFPIPYKKWRCLPQGPPISENTSWEQVKARVMVSEECAIPVNPLDSTSNWITASEKSLSLISKLTGKCAYRGRTGVFTGGANGVYYLDIVSELSNGNLVVRNVTERVKREVATVEAEIEAQHVYPLLRGREVDRWKYQGTSFILCPHTKDTKMSAIPPAKLSEEAPLSYAYLNKFRRSLEERKGFGAWERKQLDDAFYCCQRIGAYTFAPYKVVWRYICSDFRCSVISPHPVACLGPRPVFPHEKLMLVPFDDPEEAYYLCGVLSCTLARFFVESQMVHTQIAPHVISQLNIPVFDGRDELHIRISQLCYLGHKTAGRLDAIVEEIDSLSARIFNVSEIEVFRLRQDICARSLAVEGKTEDCAPV